MKSYFKSTLLMLLCITSVTVIAQDADEIIDDYINALGGAEKLEAITSLKMVGESVSPQGAAAITMMRKAPSKSKMVIDIPGGQMTFAYDGTTAWGANPWQEGGAAKKMEGAQAKRFEDEEFQDPFLNYADKGHAVKFLGEEDVNDETHYKVRLTKKNGDEIIYYFNADTNLPSQTKMLVTEGQAKGSIMVATMEDYKEVDGLMFPFVVERIMDGTSMGKTEFSEIMVNSDISDSEFTFPEEDEE